MLMDGEVELFRRLDMVCDGSHVHVPIERNAPGGKNRSSLAEDYPEKLAKAGSIDASRSLRLTDLCCR